MKSYARRRWRTWVRKNETCSQSQTLKKHQILSRLEWSGWTGRRSRHWFSANLVINGRSNASIEGETDVEEAVEANGSRVVEQEHLLEEEEEVHWILLRTLRHLQRPIAVCWKIADHHFAAKQEAQIGQKWQSNQDLWYCKKERNFEPNSEDDYSNLRQEQPSTSRTWWSKICQ